MAFERLDAVQDAATTTGTGPWTMASTGVPAQALRAFSAHTIGATFRYRASAGAQWEIGTGTLTDATHIARSVRKSSNADALVNFTTAPTVMEVVDSADVAAFTTVADGVDVAGLATIAPTTAHKVLIVDPATGLTYNSLVSALLALSGGAAPASDSSAPVFGTGAALTSSNVTQTAFTLAWPAATDNVAVSYYEYSTNGGTNWTAVGTALSANITTAQAATTYACRVRAVDAAGNTSAALSVSVTTQAAVGNSAPTMSGSLTTSGVTATGYTMTWTAGTDPDGNLAGYDYSTDGGTSFTQLGNVLSVAVTTAQAATPYNLRVRARDTAGLTSNVLSATVTTSAAAGGTMAATYVLRADITNTKFPTGPTAMSVSSPDNNINTTGLINISIRSAANGVPSDFKFVWAKYGNPCPIAFADTSVPINATGNAQTHSNSVAGPNKLGGWSDNTSQYYGIYNPISNLYIWGTAGDFMLYIAYPDGSSKAVDNNTGTPLRFTVTAP